MHTFWPAYFTFLQVLSNTTSKALLADKGIKSVSRSVKVQATAVAGKEQTQLPPSDQLHNSQIQAAHSPAADASCQAEPRPVAAASPEGGQRSPDSPALLFPLPGSSRSVPRRCPGFLRIHRCTKLQQKVSPASDKVIFKLQVCFLFPLWQLQAKQAAKSFHSSWWLNRADANRPLHTARAFTVGQALSQ